VQRQRAVDRDAIEVLEEGAGLRAWVGGGHHGLLPRL
jgi:hypothetical protein